MLPQLKVDFGLLESYKNGESVRLDCDILMFAGENEIDIGHTEIMGWAEHTNCRFDSTHLFYDNTFAHNTNEQVLQMVKEKLTTIIGAFAH